ncbi:MAG: MFS transporter [Lachnospiraceae bacterium]|nr:MFS transporter [Lachnospiraceae bacterium]
MKEKSNFKKFILLWAGELISSIGGGLTSFGLGVYIFRQTGSAASMALVTLLGFLPTLMLSVPAGVLADRYDRRLLMMIGDGCSALGIIYILVCMLNGGASLTQICIGVFFSAVFSALLEPSFRATITDLLTKEEYSRASGLVSLAGSARYLFSPVIAGFLLSISDVKLLLLIDICTFFLTVVSAAVVRKGIGSKETEKKEAFIKSVKEGWNILCKKRGVIILVAVSSGITLFMGVFQILAEPLILSFEDAETLGIAETICACGVLASGLVLGVRGLKGHYVRTLVLALAASGVFMLGFGLFENIIPICIFGFLFFTMLPFANNSLDYLVRTNIPDDAQGRAWGMIGFLSQLGYVVAYAVSGAAADSLGRMSGLGVGRGAAMAVMASGILLTLTALTVLIPGSVRELEQIETIYSKEVTYNEKYS